MKQHISKFLKSIAVFYLGFLFEFIIVLAVLFNIPANSCLRVLLSPTYYLTGALAFVVGLGLWEVKRWAWHLLIVTNIWVVYQTATFWTDYGQSHHGGLAFATWIFFIAFITYRARKEIRVPYFFPKIRWWESNPRYQLTIPVTLDARGESTHSRAAILDLAVVGCFVKTRLDFSDDQIVRLNFSVFNRSVACDGIVVWKTQSAVTHPKGVGIKFLNLKRAQKKELKLIQQRLLKISAFYRRCRYLLNPDEFVKGLEELERRPLEQTAAVKAS